MASILPLFDLVNCLSTANFEAETEEGFEMSI